MDGDHSGQGFAPLNNNAPLGAAYLGSEHGYIVRTDDAAYEFGKSGTNFLEADAGNKYLFRYNYGNEDYYTGYIYASPSYGYYQGKKLNQANELTLTGFYVITGVEASPASNDEYGPGLRQ